MGAASSGPVGGESGPASGTGSPGRADGAEGASGWNWILTDSIWDMQLDGAMPSPFSALPHSQHGAAAQLYPATPGP